MAITYVGAGTPAHGIYSAATTPAIPAGVVANDLLICFTHLRSNGSVTSTWTTHVFNDASSTFLRVSYKIAVGGDAAPTITPVGAVAGQHHSSCVLAFRGVNTSSPFGTPGSAAQYASAEDIGPIAAATATADDGAVIVFGARNDAVGTSLSNPALLTGDGLTWIEAVDAGSVDNFSHIVVDYSIWSGAPPTLTAKTFDIPGGTASATSAGVMLLLIPATTSIEFVGIGEQRTGDFSSTMTTPMPPGVVNGDLLIAFGYLSEAGTLSLTGGGGGWVQHSVIDVTQGGSSFYLHTWYRWADGTQSTVSIEVLNGTPSPRTLTSTFVLAFRGVDSSQPFGTHGSNSFNSSASNIGPIAAPSGLPSSGAVLCIGARNAPMFTSALTLSGDGLTWFEVFDNFGIDVAPYGIGLALDYAIWTGVAPTITSKSFTITGGSAGPGMGKMFVLRAAGVPIPTTRTLTAAAGVAVADTFNIAASADCSIVPATGLSVGALATGDHNDVMTPALPSGVVVGDVLIAFGYLRNAGTLGISAGWAQHSLVDTVINGTSIYLRTWYCLYDGTQVAPTITPAGGSTSPQTLAMSFVISANGYNQISPFGEDGADSFFATQANLGPISVPSTLPSSGAVLVIGIRNGTAWTSVPLLSGDGLQWHELFDTYSNTVAGLNIAATLHYAKWSGSAPPLTAKTFSPVGGASAPGMGKMFVLNAADVTVETVSSSINFVTLTTPTISSSLNAAIMAARAVGASADVNVILDQFAISLSADASVSLGAFAIALDADAVTYRIRTVVTGANSAIVRSQSVSSNFDAIVFPTVNSLSQITFADVVVEIPASYDVALTAIGDLSAQYTGTAWLVLLTLDHPGLPSPIRVTSDGVPTISQGFVFSPFPFDIILPDDIEGRPPQAQLRIDNTTQEIIALLRGLVTPPKLTVQIVRSISTDAIEHQWIGLDWTASSYDKSTITGTLTVNDLTREEFPYVTFDSRWQGLWP